MKKLYCFSLFKLFILTTIFSVSCSSDDSSLNLEQVAPERTIEPKLVGIWNGTLTGGTSGSANVVFTLESDGAFSAETESDILCSFSGSWWVYDDKFEASGEDICDGTSINLRGNNAIGIKLSGNWTASTGNNGTFSMTKQ